MLHTEKFDFMVYKRIKLLFLFLTFIFFIIKYIANTFIISLIISGAFVKRKMYHSITASCIIVLTTNHIMREVRKVIDMAYFSFSRPLFLVYF